ncbi:MAG: metallophosphoesterase, partial [Gemmatimonadetes bacterium]|nr:metallophosphoesterase [Gemmatimonadota bacterium]
MVILHASDLQVGKPFRVRAAEDLVALAHSLGPDLVVVAGDLTQRAKAREYRAARALLDRLAPLPVVVTPGNHDVPLYRVWERILAPYRNWRRFIAAELDSVTRLRGATVVALHSSAPRRAVVGGRVGASQLRRAREAFASTRPDDARVVVIHHHFVRPPDGEGGRPLPGARGLLEVFEDMGVDVILGGHVHQTHMGTSRALVTGAGPGIPWVACGTTTSSRGRGPEAGLNTLNVVRLEGTSVRVETRRHRDGEGFVAVGERTFPRPAGPARGGDPCARPGSACSRTGGTTSRRPWWPVPWRWAWARRPSGSPASSMHASGCRSRQAGEGSPAP